MNRRQVPAFPDRVGLPLVGSLLRRAAFWAAVLVPLAYLPLLATPVTDGQLRVVAALVALNVVCLVVGHGYSQR